MTDKGGRGRERETERDRKSKRGREQVLNYIFIYMYKLTFHRENWQKFYSNFSTENVKIIVKVF